MCLESYFYVWFGSLNITFSRFTYAVGYIGTSFIFMAERYPTVWMYHILFISQWTFGLFPPLAIENSASMNIHAQVFVWTPVLVLSGTYPGVELLDHR